MVVRALKTDQLEQGQMFHLRRSEGLVVVVLRLYSPPGVLATRPPVHFLFFLHQDGLPLIQL